MLEKILSNLFINQWAVFGIVTLLLLTLAETGYRFGLTFQRRNPDTAAGHSGSVQGAVLGLLGLLLGFSFAMAVGRYDTRRALVVDEANSIGTTWLRADFLPATHQREVKELLKRYTRIKLEDSKAATTREATTRSQVEIAKIHQVLWSHAEASAAEKPSPVTVSFITTLNETIDLHASRKAALLNHVPGAVWLLLLVVSGCGAWASGYGSGTGGLRSAFNQWVFPLLIGVVITLISDIDRPHQGLIGVSQQPMQDLLDSMQP
ncbi:MAG: hypothetical protein WCS43_04740 [Verrucomicrobiota bacterium]